MVARLQFCFILVIVLNFISIGISVFMGEVFFEDKVDPIFILSILLFIAATLYSIRKEKNLFFLLPFIMVGFPTVFNNIFPGNYLGSLNERGVSIFPFFTHLDLFLFINVLVYSNRNKVLYKNAPDYFVILSVLFLLSSFVNLFYANSSQEFALLSSGLYFLRYFLLLFFLLRKTNYVKYSTYFTKGLLLSVVFLFIESMTYSILSGKTTLTSGSLGTNSFGNIIGQIFVFLFFWFFSRKENRENFKGFSKVFYFTVLLVSLYIVYRTETRMAIMALVINSVLVMFTLFPVRKMVLFLCAGFLIGGFGINFFASDKFDFSSIIENISFKGNSTSMLSAVSIERSEATNSLITRLELNQTSFNMIEDSPFFGIGFNRFNILKYDYGFRDEVTIDPHNGYMLLLTGLGILGGLFWIIFIFIRPIYLFFKVKELSVKYLAILNMGMFVCEFTNAGIYKFSISSILIFCAILLELQYIYEKSKSNLIINK